MSYFGAGLWHFAAAMAFAAAIGIIGRGDALWWLRQPLFTFFLIVSSSALFIVPDRLAKRGLLKFLHFPLPDWDVLLLGPTSHRHWLTHSPIVPALCWYLERTRPHLLAEFPVLISIGVGLCVGVASHLFWDCVGSRTHKIVIVPHWFALREAPSRVYLLLGAAISLLVAFHLAGVWMTR